MPNHLQSGGVITFPPCGYEQLNYRYLKVDDTRTLQTIEKYPNPVLSPEYCRVEGPSSYVCDPDEVLTADQYRTLNHLIRQISSNSKCHCSSCAIDKHGVSIGIAIAKSIFRPYK